VVVGNKDFKTFFKEYQTFKKSNALCFETKMEAPAITYKIDLQTVGHDSYFYGL